MLEWKGTELDENLFEKGVVKSGPDEGRKGVLSSTMEVLGWNAVETVMRT